jgi:hypothetical protein
MLHCEGGDDGQTFVDHCYAGTIKTLTAYYAARHSWDAAKFGISSLYCDGGGAYLLVDPSADFRFAEQDWTVDFWAQCPNVGGMPKAGKAYLFAWHEDDDNYFALERVASSGTTTKFRARYVLAGVEIFSAAMSTYVDVSSWTHFEITRVGDTVRLFVGGVLKATGTASSSTFGANFEDWNLYVGASLLAGQSELRTLEGYIDEFRVLRGEAAHTGPFTPWSNAYSPRFQKAAKGCSHAYDSFQKAARGVAGCGIRRFQKAARGVAQVYADFQKAARGVAQVYADFQKAARGEYSVGSVSYRGFQKAARGDYLSYGNYQKAARGDYAIASERFQKAARGSSIVRAAFEKAGRGIHHALYRLQKAAAGVHAVENTAAERYEQWRRPRPRPACHIRRRR